MERQYLKWIVMSIFWTLSCTCHAQSVAELLETAQKSIDDKDYTEAYYYCNKAVRLQTVDLTDSVSVRAQYSTYLSYLHTVQLIIESIIEPDAKKLFYQLEFEAYEHTIDLAHRLFQWHGKSIYIEKAFELMEQNRNVWLLNTLRGSQSTLPKAILEEEGKFLGQITLYEDSLSDNKSKKTIDSTTIRELEKQRDYWQEQYRGFLKKNRLYVPNVTAITIEKLKKETLETNDVFIEFFNGKKATYCILIDKKRTELIRIATSSTLKKLIKTYQKTIHRDEKKYINQSHQLYKILIEPLQLKPHQRVIIVADGLLSFIPFESLLMEFPVTWDYDFSTLKYLIYEHSFVYQHSATLFEKSQKPTQKSNPKLLFLAPAFDAKTNALFKPYSADSAYFKLNPLKQSLHLGDALQIEYKGTFLSRHAASYLAFQDNQSRHQILHFATHTQVNDFAPLESKIILSKTLGDHKIKDEGNLPLKAFYQLYLKADLAVLGSCETGGNFLKRGEGLVGMAHGFRLAGVPSLVYSLWEVDEQATNEVLLNFYTELKKGVPKDIALHQAKLNYLKTANEITADPYYWASFVMNGNMQPFRFDEQKTEYGWVAFALLLLFGLTSLGYLKYRNIGHF